MRTGRRRLACALALLWLLPLSLHAQTDVQVQAQLSEQTIFEGERVDLVVTLQSEEIGSTRLPILPDIAGLEALNRTPSRRTSISMVNGVTTSELQFSWSLIARQTGSGTIPPIQVEMDDREYTTGPISFDVVARTATPSTNRRPELFAEMELSHQSPFVGQQLIATLVVYFREGLDVTSWQPASGWRTDGFWREDLINDRQPEVDSILIDGVRYRRARLLRFSLFPTRPGSLSLSPFELHLGVRTPPRRNDPFGSVFGGLGSNQRRVTLQTEAMELTARRPDPPTEGLHLQAVGDLQVERRLNRTELFVGEPIQLVTTFRGEGNLPLISRPEYPLPGTLESYPPEEETQVERRGSSMSGSRLFRQQLIPRSPGTYRLEEVTIAIFDPEQESYRHQTLPELTFVVGRSQESLAESPTPSTLPTPRTGLASWDEPNRYDWSSRWPFLLFLLPVLLFRGTMILWNHRERLRTDERFARSHYALSRAESLLEQASDELSEGRISHAAKTMHRALTSFISDRTGLPAAGVPDRQLAEEVESRSEDPHLATTLRTRLERCTTIGYAPESIQQNLESELNACRDLLNRLKEVL